MILLFTKDIAILIYIISELLKNLDSQILYDKSDTYLLIRTRHCLEDGKLKSLADRNTFDFTVLFPRTLVKWPASIVTHRNYKNNSSRLPVMSKLISYTYIQSQPHNQRFNKKFYSKVNSFQLNQYFPVTVEVTLGLFEKTLFRKVCCYNDLYIIDKFKKIVSSRNGSLVRFMDAIIGQENSLTRIKRSSTPQEAKSFIEYVHDTSNVNISFSIQVTYLVTKEALKSNAVNSSELRFLEIQLQTLSVTNVVQITSALLVITKSVQIYDSSPNPAIVKFIITISHASNSTLPAYNVIVKDYPYQDMALVDDLAPTVGTIGLSHIKDNRIEWTIGQLDVADTKDIVYKTQLKVPDNVQSSSTKSIYYTTKVYYHPNNMSTMYLTLEISICITKIINLDSIDQVNHGYMALSIVMAVLLGILIVLLAILLYSFFCRRKLPANGITDLDTEKYDETPDLLLDTKTEQKDASTLIGLHTQSVDDSLVSVFTISDRLQLNRELESLDLLSTITVDMELDDERNESLLLATRMLIHSLFINGDISKANEDTVLQSYNKKAKGLADSLNKDFQIKKDVLVKDISLKNKNLISQMGSQHATEKAKLYNLTEAISQDERVELETLLENKQKIERNDFTYGLLLEQNRKSEELRKEYSLKRRSEVGQLHKQILYDLAREGGLVEEQCTWLMKEHAENCSKVNEMYDEELARQKMILEEKLALRRFLADCVELKEEDEKECFKMGVNQQLKEIKKLKKSKVLSPYESNMLAARVTDDMMNFENKLKKELQHQRAELHKRLSNMKKQNLTNKKTENQSHVDVFIKDSKEQQTDGPIDPLTQVGQRLHLLSKHRHELSVLEDEIDTKSIEELEDVMEKEYSQTRQDVSQYKLSLVNDLQTKGLSPAKAAAIFKQHEENLNSLRQQQFEERKRQKQLFLEKLAKARESIRNQHENDRDEQKVLRDHDYEVLQSLIDHQLSLSQQDRDTIMKEYHKHTVQLETNLTLSKIRQQEILEKRLSSKRKQREEKIYKQHKSIEDDDVCNKDLEEIKNDLEQRLSVLSDEHINVNSELEEVRVAMMKDRAFELRSHEDRLGEMIVALQLTKAKEIAEIEEKQTAIQTLQTNMMDELTERGVLTDPECKNIIERHIQQQNELLSRIETQRMKQEKIVQERLQDRLSTKERILNLDHQNELDSVGQTAQNDTMLRLRKITISQRQMLEIEKFRNRAEREMSQELEDMRRQFEIKKLGALQIQELQFITGLIKLGKFGHDELLDVLHLLFPAKTTEQLSTHVLRIKDINFDKQNNSPESKEQSHTSNLKKKVKSMIMATIDVSSPSKPFKISKNKKDKEAGYKSRSRKTRRVESPQLQTLSERPEPVGQDGDSEVIEARPASGNLTPVDVHQRDVNKHRKKSGGLKRLVERQNSNIND